MVLNTSSKSVIPVPEEIADMVLLSQKIQELYCQLNVELQEILCSDSWIEINDGDYYYINEDKIIIPNPQKIKLDPEGFVSLPGVDWGKMSLKVAEKWFYSLVDANPIVIDRKIPYVDIHNETRDVGYVYCYDCKGHMRMLNGVVYSWSIADKQGIKIPLYCLNELEQERLLSFFLTNKYNVFFDEENCKIFNFFTNIVDLIDMDKMDNHVLIINDKQKYDIIYNEYEQLFFESNKERNKTQLQDNIRCLNLDEDEYNVIKKYLLDCDKLRINMETYPEHILYDPESGHWGLWENGNSKLEVSVSKKLIARNPIYDALENKSGIVGIDFGTKSTVVMYRQSRADILPMRIGSGQFSRTVSKNDYENPTVMELRNVKKFLEDYRKYDGRPNTKWEDVLISHEAAEQLNSEQSKGDTFASFFSELKQWASDKARQVTLRDLQGNEINLSSYLSLSKDDFDPIEIYAYYLGMFINNMIHKIYLRYKLSFPATVEKQVRDKILDSFTKGIKKSLPKQVLEDEDCMKIFKIEQGASEPAAYAITALTEYGFDPEEDEKYYYGIFDFGGGTTDFDFGVWSMEKDEPENYDYQISHFGQGGDPYLGGENLLQILAYHVFIKNYDKLLMDKIVFVKPFGEKEIAGKDYLICQDSQYAHFNQKRMMEKLRGVWEGNEEVREFFESGTMVLPLFTMEGEQKNNYSLEVDIAELDKLIEQRIDKGVAQFFDALKNCFGVNSNQKDIHNVEGINIFLAGNSSKSPIVYKLFKKYINLFTERISEKTVEYRQWFKIYPPLGTELSKQVLCGNISPMADDILEYIENDENYSHEIKDFDKSELNNIVVQLSRQKSKTFIMN